MMDEFNKSFDEQLETTPKSKENTGVVKKRNTGTMKKVFAILAKGELTAKQVHASLVAAGCDVSKASLHCMLSQYAGKGKLVKTVKGYKCTPKPENSEKTPIVSLPSAPGAVSEQPPTTEEHD